MKDAEEQKGQDWQRRMFELLNDETIELPSRAQLAMIAATFGQIEDGEEAIRKAMWLYLSALSFTSGEAKATTSPPEGLIDEPELLRRLPVSRRTAWNLRACGKLPFVKLGKRVFYHWLTVESALLRQQKEVNL